MQNTTSTSKLSELLSTKDFLNVPKEGDIVAGTVIAVSPREVLIDLDGYKTGIVGGIELEDLERVYPNLKPGDRIEATVLELENEDGQVELSVRFAGQLRAWDAAADAKTKNTIVEGKIIEANRGGLLVTWLGMSGFLPVSQLSPEHYPRVPGGDKGKILDRLRTFVGNTLRLQVIDSDPKDGKLIFSEKSLWEEEQKDLLAKYKIGDIVEGTITAIADFGVFIGFSATPTEPEIGARSSLGGDRLEGLVHISEIAWQRIDNPADLIQVGDKVKAKILNIQGSKIFLSMKALQDDPWKKVSERYTIGQTVKARVLKVNPFGLFVELDPEIHGLAHISELNVAPGQPLTEQIKPGDEREFRVVSIEPEHHRLGLSEKKASMEAGASSNPETAPETTTPSPEASAPAPDVVQSE